MSGETKRKVLTDEIEHRPLTEMLSSLGTPIQLPTHRSSLTPVIQYQHIKQRKGRS